MWMEICVWGGTWRCVKSPHLEAEEELDNERMVGLDEDVALRHDALRRCAASKSLVLALDFDRKKVSCGLLARQVDTTKGTL